MSSLLYTLVAVLILLVLNFWFEVRRPMLGVITTLPVVLVVVLSFGIMWAAGIPFGPITATVAALAVGIGIPYMIHVTHRYEEDRIRYDNENDAIESTLTHTGGALAGSAMTTIFGFGILMTSTTIPFRQFGLVTAYTILLSLLAAILVLPSMLVVWDRWHRNRGEQTLDPELSRAHSEKPTHEPRPSFDRDPGEVAEAAAIPEDLDSNVVGEYHVPDTNRAGGGQPSSTSWEPLRLAGADCCRSAAVPDVVDGGWACCWWSGPTTSSPSWNLEVREGEALEIANRTVEFPVGHASASLGFTGWRARPVWNVLVFSADDPPSERALGEVDGIDGDVADSYVEPVPAPPVDQRFET